MALLSIRPSELLSHLLPPELQPFLDRALALDTSGHQFRLGCSPILASIARWAASGLPDLKGAAGDLVLRYFRSAAVHDLSPLAGPWGAGFDCLSLFTSLHPNLPN
jgi:hypothetical protein